MQNRKETLDEWFMQAVLPHEPALLRYLYRNWRDNSSDVKDLCQEVLTRVYSAAQQDRPIKIKAFIFTTARNLLCDLVRRAQVVRIESVMDMETLNIPSEEVGVEEQVSARQELKYLQNAMKALPQKCRQVVELRRIYGFSQRETARRLGISEAAVESHIQRGVRGLSDSLRNISEIAATRFNAKSHSKAKKEKKT